MTRQEVTAKLARAVNPMHALDLTDEDEYPDHNKMLVVIVVAATIWLHAVGNPFPWYTQVTLGAIAFGPRMFSLFLRKWTNGGKRAGE